MELQAFTKTIFDLLSTEGKYIIPGFKRGYFWTIEEFSELFKDILSNITTENNNLVTSEYFLGSIVLVRDEKTNSLFIVDGSQRLMTVTILLCAIIKSFKNAGNLSKAESLQRLIEGKSKDNTNFFKLQNEIPNTYLQQSIQAFEGAPLTPETDEQRIFQAAYDFFIGKLSKDSLFAEFQSFNPDMPNIPYVKLLETITDQALRLIMIMITVSSQEDAYTILGTLNADVKHLTSIDFIKTEIIKILNSKNYTHEAEEKWREVRNILYSRDEKISMEGFFADFWPSKYELIPSEKLYRSFKSKVIQNSEGINDFLNSLLVEAKNYVRIADPVPGDWKQQEEKGLYDSLTALELFKASASRILILALLNVRSKDLISLHELCNAVSNIEHFHFISTAVCKVNSSEIINLYSTRAKQFRQCGSQREAKLLIRELAITLNELLPDFEEFKTYFRKLSYAEGKPKQKKLIQYIFKNWESYLIETNELEMAEITIEHILPQSYHSQNVGMIGNLLPLAVHLNNTAGDRDFVSKLNLYRRSRSMVVQHFINKYHKCAEWTDFDIMYRTDDIAKTCYYEIFKIRR